MRKILLFAVLFISIIFLYSYDNLVYISNNVQLHENIRFKATSKEYSIFLKKNKFTYFSLNDLAKFFDHNHGEIEISNLQGEDNPTGLLYHAINKTIF